MQRRSGAQRSGEQRSGVRHDFALLLLCGLLASGAAWIPASAGSSMTGLWLLAAAVLLTPGLVLAAVLLVVSRGAAEGRATARLIAIAVVVAVDAVVAMPVTAALASAVDGAEWLGIVVALHAPALLSAWCGAVLLARIRRS